ncbi:hypothetical protein [Desulfonema magnum]|uniref:Uncharacterized protein n=1 Tax=Desulfonema magnum TaxID=45655 RepID=A0A975BP13_9BACT|nr:hypothetical protein [Desulfonema magnum]QTA88450.1 Uncharacterized protein dnm_044960 [Desulfonema magnum]
MNEFFLEEIVSSSWKLEKSDLAFERISQLHPIVFRKIFTHLLAVCELIMGFSVNAAVHVIKDNILSVISVSVKERK